jgi:hypothetical protein
MPHATRHRQSFYKNPSDQVNCDARFVHYTSADSALKIIKSKRIWMRNVKCMSDYREVQHGYQLFHKFFSDKSNGSAFTEALDACAPGVAKEAIKMFDGWWNDIQFNTYVTSMSEHAESEDFHGRLSMWRAFGGNPARVAIVFKIPWISGVGQELHVTLSPVAYLAETDVHKGIREVIEKVREEADFLRQVDRSLFVFSVFAMLMNGVCCLKHEGFREEREWRGIYSPKRWPSPLMESSIETVGGVPQIVYKIPVDMALSDTLAEIDFSRIFDRLIIGPSSYPSAMWEAFTAALTSAGVSDAVKKVFVSSIPLRS